MKEALLAHLKKNHVPLTRKELLKGLGINDGALNKILAQLENEGEIVYTAKGKAALPHWLGYLRGTLTGNQRGFGFLTPDEPGEEDVFIPGGAMQSAIHGDTVLVKLSGQRAYRGKREGEVVKVLNRARETVVGRIERTHNAGFLIPEDPRIPDIFIPLNAMAKAKNGDLAVVRIEKWPSRNRNAQGRVEEILGKGDSIDAAVKGIIRTFELPDVFSKGAMNQASAAPTEVTGKDRRGREDFRNLLTVTIDGADAKDLDDAVSLVRRGDGYTLYVHIADVSHYVLPGTPMDQDAYERGTSVYFPSMVIPMLPVELSNGICSLNAGVERLCLTCIMELNALGEVCNYRFSKGIIKVDQRCTYEDVTRLLAGDEVEGYEEVRDLLLLMAELSEKLTENREGRGSIDFDLSETDIVTDECGNAVSIGKKDRGRANLIIEDFMLAANECAAAFGTRNGLPFLYRIHEEPDEGRMEEFFNMAKALGISVPRTGEVHPKALQALLKQAEDTPYHSVISRTMLRCMKKARYGESPLGHFGLALKNYCHFTSPIRRYPDLVVHRAIKALISYGPGCRDLEAMEGTVHAMGEHTSRRERTAMEAERAVDDLLKAQYMQQYIGQPFKGIITSVLEFGIFVELDNTAEGLVRITSLDDDYYYYDEKLLRLVGKHKGKTFAIGDEMDIIVGGVNLDLRRVEFVPNWEGES
ncbi:MAG: ribonuclease R [Clostridiales bacterium]|nr:ribonuclease R [Clostridiales bacterium]